MVSPAVRKDVYPGPWAALYGIRVSFQPLPFAMDPIHRPGFYEDRKRP
jgi:hypothetical protein